MAELKKVVVIGGGVTLLSALSALRSQKIAVTAIVGNSFLEWPTTWPLVHPEDFPKYVAPNIEDWQLPGITYMVGHVVAIDPAEHRVTLADGQAVEYQALVVATGLHFPLFVHEVGQSLEERRAEVETAAAAIKGAKTVVLNGTGLVALEIAGNIATQFKDEVRVIMLSRTGTVLKATTPKMRQRILARMEHLKIQVLKASTDARAVSLEAGTLQLHGVESGTPETLDYDVFIPCFSSRPNTHFMDAVPGMLDDRHCVKVNAYLQAMDHEDIFVATGSDHPARKLMPASDNNVAAAQTVVKNLISFLQDQPLQEYKFKGSGTVEPDYIRLGDGRQGYAFMEQKHLPCPVQCCCCLPCGGGFPCCPLPCCWCCCPGCPRVCGNCCGPVEGSGTSLCLFALAPKFAGMRGVKGLGAKPKGAPQKQVME